jgi:hypothetical protein
LIGEIIEHCHTISTICANINQFILLEKIINDVKILISFNSIKGNDCVSGGVRNVDNPRRPSQPNTIPQQ